MINDQLQKKLQVYNRELNHIIFYEYRSRFFTHMHQRAQKYRNQYWIFSDHTNMCRVIKLETKIVVTKYINFPNTRFPEHIPT